MEYTVTRGAQTFGPYTEAELRAYVASGNIVLNDALTGGEFEKPVAVRKALQRFDLTHTLRTGLRSDVPSPPDLPWWLAAILDVLTALTFFVIWDIIEGIWMWRVRPRSRALWYYLTAGLLFAIDAPVLYSSVLHNVGINYHAGQLHGAIFGIAAFIMRIVARFSMRRSLCEHFTQTEPIGLQLSWFWTLIFGGLYFQYHFNKINEAKRALLDVPA